MITTTDNQEDLMRSYLLGELSEPEQVALESGFFADSDLLEQIQEIETDLVDVYVRGILPHAERKQFELHYLTTPEHQERVAFAKELLRATNEQALPQPAKPKESFWGKLLAGLRAPQFAFGAAAAAAILLVAGTVWLNNQKANWQQQLAQSKAEHAAEQQRMRDLENQIAQQGEQNAELNAELAKLNERLRAESPKPVSPPSLFSFILLPGVRGGSEQQTLKLPPGTDQIGLRMKIENGNYRRYLVNLLPVDGGQSFSTGMVNASTGKSGTTVYVKIPADKLSSGDYFLTLKGVDAAGSAEEINRYSFRVAKQ